MILSYEMGVSTKSYTQKPTFKNVRYNIRENVNKDEMKRLIQQGYCFSHSFHVNGEFGNKEKTINNFKQTNYIWFDFDDCINDISNVYQSLTYKPNIAYTTISNMQEGKSNRFRIIYFTDFIIYSNDDYKYYLNLLLNTIINDLGNDYLKYIDNSCANVSQQMFGSNQKSIIIDNDKIYNKNIFDDIINNYSIDDLLNKGKCSKNFKSNIIEKERKILKQDEEITTPVSELIELLTTTDMRQYQPILSNEHTAILDSEDIYTDVTEQDIYKINSLYNKENKIKKVRKGHRNKTLFSWGIIIKNINPNITIYELTKSLYWLYINRCERSDDFNMLQVCNTAISVFKTDIEDLKDLGKRKYLINPDYKDLSRADKFKELGKARRKTRDNNILPYYDFNKTPKENATELGWSENTIRNCLNDNNIKTTNQEKYDRFIVIYGNCPDASIRQLMKLTNLSDKTVQRYRKKYDDLILSVQYDIKPIFNFQYSN